RTSAYALSLSTEPTLCGAGSGGHRNVYVGVEGSGWGLPLEGLADPRVEVVLYGLDLLVGHGGKVGALGVKVPDQQVGVLVASALPGRVGVAEVHLGIGGHRERDVGGHLAAAVPGQRLA